MKYTPLEYAPEVLSLIKAFDMVCGSTYDSKSQEDCYVKALLALRIVYIEDETYVSSNEWRFLLEKNTINRINVFRNQISQRVEAIDIIDFISGNSRCDYATLKHHFTEMDEATLRTWLMWLTSLEILVYDENYYSLNENDSENDDTEYNNDEPSIYGNEIINIKDDKYSVFEYCRKINKGFILMFPDFQRNLVWNKVQQSRFIESILMCLPLPPIYLKKESDTKFIVVDGLQRSATLKDFMDDKFELIGLNKLQDINGLKFSQLDSVHDGLSARIEDCQLNIYVMQPSVSMSMIYDVFNRINTGGTQLNRQEIRNCILKGHATELLKDVADTSSFCNAIGYGINSQRMKDREAVLRCVAFAILDYSMDYEGSMDGFLEKAMRKMNQMSSSEIETLKNKVISVFDHTYHIFGNANFRIRTGIARGRINIAVMETIFNYFYNTNDDDTTSAQTYQIRYKELLKDEDYLGAVRSSTGLKKQVELRFNKSKEYLLGTIQ